MAVGINEQDRITNTLSTHNKTFAGNYKYYKTYLH